MIVKRYAIKQIPIGGLCNTHEYLCKKGYYILDLSIDYTFETEKEAFKALVELDNQGKFDDTYMGKSFVIEEVYLKVDGATSTCQDYSSEYWVKKRLQANEEL